MRCEVAFTTADFSAAASFVAGGILCFSESTTCVGTWLFLIGSVRFGLCPTIKLLREISHLRLGSYDKIGIG
ncbi:MAG: YrhK family protein [Pseudomonadota bacterium]